MKLIPILLIFAGVLFIYSGVKDKDPRNVIFESLNLKQRVKDPVGIGETDLGDVTLTPHVAGSSTTNDAGVKVVSV